MEKSFVTEKSQILTTAEAALILGRKKRSLDNMRSQGRGPAYIKESDRFVRYLLNDVLEYRDGKRIVPVNN